MFKNTYEQITLSSEVFQKMIETRKLLFFMVIFSGLVYSGMVYYIALHSTDAQINFPTYNMLHELWLYIFPFLFIFLIFHRNNLLFRAKYFRLLLALVLSTLLLTILLWIISIIFITNPSAILVNSIYLSHLALFVFYFTKYLRLWNGVFSNETGEKYALRIEQYEWREDVIHPEINAPKENNEEENRPFYTKAFEKVGNVVVASGFILPMIFAMSATGTGGSVPIMVVELFAFLIAPFAYYAIAKSVAWYLFIRRLEKEKGVIIYNGVWLT